MEAGRRQASHRLAVLLGLPATDLASQFAAAAIPTAPVEISIGVPGDLLRRRPDIMMAERQLAAETARIGVAEADFYPSLSINGFLGYTAKDMSQLFEPKSFTGFLLPTVQWPILNYGRIVNGVRAQDRDSAARPCNTIKRFSRPGKRSTTPWPDSCRPSSRRRIWRKTCASLKRLSNLPTRNIKGERPTLAECSRPKRRWSTPRINWRWPVARSRSI